MDLEIISYLERELIENNRIVTFRLLSRKFSIHVNVAKNELASFYSRERESSVLLNATFWLSGIPKSRTTNGTSDGMEVDGGEINDWIVRKVIIVDDADLESAKASFQTIHALHVYSLSSTPVENATHLCRPAREIREMDRAGGEDLARAVGRIRSLQVKRGATAGKFSKDTSSRKQQASIAQVTSSKSSANHIAKPPPPRLSSINEKEKPKATGKLDFTKAKVKDITKNSNDFKAPVKMESVKIPLPISTEKRGTKRKSDAGLQLSGRADANERQMNSKAIDVESKPSVKLTKGSIQAARVKKGVILSEDEEEQMVVKTRGSGKGKKRLSDDSDTEQSVRAMMDVDDEDVVKVSKPPSSPVSPKDEDEEPPMTDHVDSAMDEDSDDPAPKAKARQRKTKKTVPIGTNGIRKKRVVKSKTDFDEKGYMVTVDYSSYESVDEEEEEETDNIKSRAKAKAKATNVKRKAPKDIILDDAHLLGSNNNAAISKKSELKNFPPKPPVAKGRPSGDSQKSLASFFGSGNGKAKK